MGHCDQGSKMQVGHCDQGKKCGGAPGGGQLSWAAASSKEKNMQGARCNTAHWIIWGARPVVCARTRGVGGGISGY